MATPLVAAAAAMAAVVAAAIVRAQPRERQSFALAAASKRLFLLNPEAIARCFAAIASRRKRVGPAAALAAAVDVAATIVAAVVVVAADVTKFYSFDAV